MSASSPASAGRREVDHTSVIGKVVAVLRAFGGDDHGVPLAELRRRTGLPKSTLHRVAEDLVTVGLLDKDASGYHLSGLAFEIGMRASVERRLLDVAIPFMEDLYERTRGTVHLGVLEGTEVVYVHKLGGHDQAAVPTRIGGRMLLYCTAIGKAILAHGPPELWEQVLAAGLERRTPRTVTAPGLLHGQLDRVRQTGVAYKHEESVLGITCVAAPILESDEPPVAALSVTGAVTRFHAERHAVHVRAAAAGVAATLARRHELRG